MNMFSSRSDFHEISFLRVNAAHFREIAKSKQPAVATYLRNLADKWSAEADKLELAEPHRADRLIARTSAVAA
jgi:hypothetical protein